MATGEISRRRLLQQGSSALAGLVLLQSPLLAQAFQSRPGEEVVPWLDQPPANPSGGVVMNLPRWEELASSWLTPTNKFFSVAHYNRPVIDEKSWRRRTPGLVIGPGPFRCPSSRPDPGKRSSSRSNVPAITGSRGSPLASEPHDGRARRSPRSCKKREFREEGSRWSFGAAMRAKRRSARSRCRSNLREACRWRTR